MYILVWTFNDLGHSLTIRKLSQSSEILFHSNAKLDVDKVPMAFRVEKDDPMASSEQQDTIFLLKSKDALELLEIKDGQMQKITNESLLDHYRNKISHLDQKLNKNEKSRNFLSNFSGD